MPVILPGQTDIYALTDARLSCGRTLETVVSALLGAGVKIIQYREKHMKSGEMLEECRLMRRLTREAGACFIVDDHVDLAILAEADGVHIGQEDFPLPAVRQLVGPKMCIGLSTHSPEQARAAVAVGADYIGVGPIFATKTKEDVVAPGGLRLSGLGGRQHQHPLRGHRRHQGTQHHGCGPSRGPLLRPGLRTGGRPRHRRQGAGRTRRHAAGDVGYDFLRGGGPPRLAREVVPRPSNSPPPQRALSRLS